MKKSRAEENIELIGEAIGVANEKANVLVTEIGGLRSKPKTKEDYEKLAELYQQIEELYEPKKELELSFQEQYKSQTEILKRAGILQELESGQLGIKGIDGKEYPLPAEQDVAKRIEANKELVEKKQEQGFKKLLLVPFGMKLSDLTDTYRQSILRHGNEGRLFSTQRDANEQIVPLPLDKSKPLYVWDGYNDADVNGELVYHPKEFSENHGGKTKQSVLSEQAKEESSPGWRILFVEDMPDIPRQNKGKTNGGRKQFETNDTPNNYLKILQNENAKKDSPYQGEEGMTPEDQLMYAILHIEETDQVVDDWQGNGAVSYQIGAYLPASGYVPFAYWNRDDRRAHLDGRSPDRRYGGCGVRPAVRI